MLLQYILSEPSVGMNGAERTIQFFFLHKCFGFLLVMVHARLTIQSVVHVFSICKSQRMNFKDLHTWLWFGFGYRIGATQRRQIFVWQSGSASNNWMAAVAAINTIHRKKNTLGRGNSNNKIKSHADRWVRELLAAVTFVDIR